MADQTEEGNAAASLDVTDATQTKVPNGAQSELLAAQVSELITVDSSAQERKLNDEIETMLLKISEFMEVVEMIRSDTNICINSNLPLISEKSGELQATFDRIDALEVFVSHIDETLKKLEAQVAVAEGHFNTFTSLKKKFLGALSSLGRKHQDTSPQYRTAESLDTEQFQSVNIFNTGDFFLERPDQPAPQKTAPAPPLS